MQGTMVCQQPHVVRPGSTATPALHRWQRAAVVLAQLCSSCALLSTRTHLVGLPCPPEALLQAIARTISPQNGR